MNCPECGAKSVSTLVVLPAPWVGRHETTKHGYCPNCEPPHFPPVPGHWSPWDADWSKHVESMVETVKQRRERMLHGRGVWG